MNKIIKYAAAGLCSIILALGNVNLTTAEIFTQQNSYTVAKIHPKKLSVYTQPNKDSIIYTTIYQNQEIECVNYENDWLTLAFQDGFFGFIDAYQAELKTYYPDYIQEKPQQIINYTIEETYETQVINEEFIQQEEKQLFYEQVKSVEYIEEYPPQQQPLYEEQLQISYFNQENFYKEQQKEEQQYNEQLQNFPYEEYPQNFSYNEQLQSFPHEEEQQQYNDEVIINEEQQYDDEEIIIDEQNYYLQEEEEQYQVIDLQNGNNDIVDYADQYIGNPYSYGGNSLTDGIDCSHFVWQVLTNTGHYSGDYATSDDWANLGEDVGSLDNAVAGDVIVYPGHVAIYDGEGGIVEAKGQEYGITHDRSANHGDIIAIRHFD